MYWYNAMEFFSYKLWASIYEEVVHVVLDDEILRELLGIVPKILAFIRVFNTIKMHGDKCE